MDYHIMNTIIEFEAWASDRPTKPKTVNNIVIYECFCTADWTWFQFSHAHVSPPIPNMIVLVLLNALRIFPLFVQCNACQYNNRQCFHLCPHTENDYPTNLQTIHSFHLCHFHYSTMRIVGNWHISCSTIHSRAAVFTIQSNPCCKFSPIPKP